MKSFMRLVDEVRIVDSDAAKYLLTDARKLPSFQQKEYLYSVMVWKETPHGFEYWRNIAEQIEHGCEARKTHLFRR